MNKVIELYNDLIDNDFFTDRELQLLTSINGFSLETLCDAIYSRYGYPDFSSLMECIQELEED